MGCFSQEHRDKKKYPYDIEETHQAAVCESLYTCVCMRIHCMYTEVYSAYVNITDLETLESSKHSSRALPRVIPVYDKLYVSPR